MSIIYTTRFKSELGELILGDIDGELCMMDWLYRTKRQQIDDRIKQYFRADFEEKTTDLHVEIIRQLTAYFAKERTAFDLPIRFAGTAFQEKVWKALLQIQYGQTTSYLALSTTLGDPKAIRAVATANGANALSIVVPCHRVIRSKGALIGYAGGLRAKDRLLQLEGRSSQMRLF